jgi:hypothetical protein
LPQIPDAAAPLVSTAQVAKAFGSTMSFQGEQVVPVTANNPEAQHTCSWQGPALFKSSSPYDINRVSVGVEVIGPFKTLASASAGYGNELKEWGPTAAVHGIGARAVYVLAAQDTVTSQLIALWSRYIVWVTVGAPKSVTVKHQQAGEAVIARATVARIPSGG